LPSRGTRRLRRTAQDLLAKNSRRDSNPAIEWRALMLQDSLFVPVFSSILRNRKLLLALLVATAIQLGLVSAHLPGWPCPFARVLGFPCPGCGLTRATLLLFRGEWRESIAFHAFAPLFLVALTITLAATVAPERSRDWLIPTIESIERRTGITNFLLLGLILYWLARLLIMRSAFAQMLQQ